MNILNNWLWNESLGLLGEFDKLNLLFLVISFGCERFWEELGFLNEKLV